MVFCDLVVEQHSPGCWQAGTITSPLQAYSGKHGGPPCPAHDKDFGVITRTHRIVRDERGLLMWCLKNGFLCPLMIRVGLITLAHARAPSPDSKTQLAAGQGCCPWPLLKATPLPGGGRYFWWCPFAVILTSPPWHWTVWTWLLH